MAERAGGEASPTDLLVVGGGVNGCAIARDAAGRGLSARLVERGDLGGATSSASSKLIHGGLRYLEHGAFRLVREALAEREVLLAAAPHVVWPLRFVLPHRPGGRPRWMLRAGLFLYDHLARRASLPGHESLDLSRAPEGAPLRPELRRGFAFGDAWVEDSRLVLLLARDAAARGALVETRTALVSARREGGLWRAVLRDGAGERAVSARALVNAAGPWLAEAQGRAGAALPGGLRLVRGSHLVLPRLWEGAHAYLLLNDDRRVVFALPYEGRFTLVGTTEAPHDPGRGPPRCAPEEAAYLCEAVNRQFRARVSPGDAVWSFSGVRPLRDDGAEDASAVSRDYALELDAAGPPLLSVLGGKVTTHRRLAEEAVGRLLPGLGRPGAAWTARATLPGGDLGGLSREAFAREAGRRHPWLPPDLLARLLRTHGGELDAVLGGARSLDGLGPDLGGGLHAREVAWMVGREWAREAEDVLWRRTKRGLHMTPAEREAFAERFAGVARAA